MHCNSISRTFNLDLRDEERAPRPMPEITINRVAENAVHYLPTSEWERDVAELIRLTAGAQ